MRYLATKPRLVVYFFLIYICLVFRHTGVFVVRSEIVVCCAAEPIKTLFNFCDPLKPPRCQTFLFAIIPFYWFKGEES